jgi:hypothetical protein
MEVTNEEKEHFQRHFFNQANASRRGEGTESLLPSSSPEQKIIHKISSVNASMKLPPNDEKEKPKKKRIKGEGEDPLWAEELEKRRKISAEDSKEYEKITIQDLESSTQAKGEQRRPRRPRAAALSSVCIILIECESI